MQTGRTMIETRPLMSMFLTALLVATMSGCDTFDNPLRWEESSMADDLVGTWNGVEGKDAGMRARVWRADDKTLGFEVTSPENPRATFLGNVLEAGPVHVLQVRLDSYREIDEDGDSDPATGFYFMRIVALPENGVSVHDLDVDTMGRVADKELAASGLEFEGETFARCLRGSTRKVDPYRELARIRTCVAHRLPSESLEQLFLEHADRVFSGETRLLVRE